MQCGRAVRSRSGVVVKRTVDGYGYGSGLVTCGSLWGCLSCSYRVRSKRARHVAIAAAAHIALGGGVLFGTFTMSHERGEDLDNTWPILSDGWMYMTSGRQWMEFKEFLHRAGPRGPGGPGDRRRGDRSGRLPSGAGGHDPHHRRVPGAALPAPPQRPLDRRPVGRRETGAVGVGRLTGLPTFSSGSVDLDPVVTVRRLLGAGDKSRFTDCSAPAVFQANSKQRGELWAFEG